MRENGDGILVVNGDCTFWMYDFLSGKARTGTFTAEQATSLTTSLHLPEWTSWFGLSVGSAYCGTGPARYRFDALELDIPGCTYPGAGVPNDLSQLVQTMTQELDSPPAATEVTGPGRIAVFAQPSDIHPSGLPWPLSTPPAQLARLGVEGSSFTPGTDTVLSADDAAKIRAVRDDLAGGPTSVNDVFYLLGPDNISYAVYFRDELPGEDSNGLVHLFNH